MTSYEAWLLLHLISVAAWAGGALAITLVVISAERSRKPVELASLAPVNAWLGPHVFTPAALIALVSGILLVLDGPWTFGELWIVLGLIGFALTFLPGFVFLGPESKRIREAIGREGPNGPEARRRVRRVLVVSRTVTLLLVFVIADMVLKPTGDDGWLLAAGGALLAAFLAGILLLARTAPRPATSRPPSGTPEPPGEAQ